MNDKQRNRVIRQYNIDDLKQDITRLDGEIKTFSEILARAKKAKDKKNMKYWAKAIKKAKSKRRELKELISMIRKARKDDDSI